MNSTAQKIIIFLSGAVVGGVISVLIARKLYFEKAIDAFNEYLNSELKKRDSVNSDPSPQEIDEDDTDQVIPNLEKAPEFIQVKEEDMKEYHKIISKYSKPDLSELQTMLEKGVSDFEDGGDKDALAEDKLHSGLPMEETPPYMISEEEFLENDGLFDKLEYTYFPDTEIMMDEETGYIVPVETAGMDNLRLIGSEQIDGRKTIFVRNVECGIDIRIEEALCSTEEYMASRETPQDG